MFSPRLAKLITLAALPFAAGAASANDQGPWLIRLRAIDVVTAESSTVSIGGEATLDNSIVPELDISYFWTDNLATELILATSKHHTSAIGTALGDVDLGHVWVLPPTLLMQYHFAPDAAFRPYLGAGVNYTFFYNENAGALDSIHYDDGFGIALQAGFDIPVNDKWLFNVDAKKIFLNTDVSINGSAVTADVDLDPWVLGVGFGYRF